MESISLSLLSIFKLFVILILKVMVEHEHQNNDS
jgi:hypothetical protein